ncbi:MAG: polyprenol phosphomannose-dependent alpha 1,6 mannosyltransferase MptB [Micrococcus sp.]|nr:polyprenol phosphomannose-dependent alpha 1,6 mannosyltransferase MptB [Micrococcus sp.]
MSAAHHSPPRTESLASLDRLRRWLGALPATRWLIGGADEDTALSLRQGLLGSLMIMVGSWGVGWLASTPASLFARTTILNPLRVEPAGVIACAVLLVLGSLLLVRAWLRLGQRLAGRWAGSRDVVVRATWLWSAPLMLAFPVFSRDVYSYLGQGRLLHAGLNPYEDWISELPGWFMQGADSIWAESPSPYGPLFLLIARAVWFLTGGSPEPAFLLFRGVSVIGMGLCLWAVPRLARRFGTEPGWATWISIANPLFALYMIAGIHNDALMIGLLLCGFVLLGPESSRGRNLAGLVLVSLSIAIKPLTVIALPFAGLLMLRGAHQSGAPGPRADGPFAGLVAGPAAPASGRNVPHPDGGAGGRADTPGLSARTRAWVACLAVTAVVLAAVGGLTGLWFGWVPAMLTSGDAAFPYAPFGLLGLGIGWLVDTVSGTGVRPVADVVYAAGKVLVAALTAWLALTRRPVNPVLATGLALGAAVLLAPIIQPWYLLWVLPMFAVVRRWRGWPIWTLYLLVMVLVVIGVVDQLSVAQWISLLWVRIITGAVGAVYMVFIVFLDPKTSTLFPFTGRRRVRVPDHARPRAPGGTPDGVPLSAPNPPAGLRRGGAAPRTPRRPT